MEPEDEVDSYMKKDLDVLKNIKFRTKPGELIAIIGQVAQGKSSFLQAILGEMAGGAGKVRLNGSIAYAS